MKNIAVLNTEEAMERIPSVNEEYAVMIVTDNKSNYRGFFNNWDDPELIEKYSNHAGIRDYLKEDDNCVEVVSFEDNRDDDYKYWQADEIIRFCQRQFCIDNTFIIYDKSRHRHYGTAMNIANQIAVCYGLDFEYDSSVHYMYDLCKKIELKYDMIINSPLYTLSPLEYGKLMCRLMFDQVKQTITGKRLERFNAYNFFKYRQGCICLKNGNKFNYHLETDIENIYLTDIDEIEYIEFENVPEMAELSAFEDMNDLYNERSYEIFDFYNDNDSLKRKRDFEFRFTSEKGIVREKRCCLSQIPEKYKNYQTMQREYWEFYKDPEVREVYPKMIDIYEGIEGAEKYLEEKNGYKPKYSLLEFPEIDEYEPIWSLAYSDYLYELFKQMDEKDIWKKGRLEARCAYAAAFYAKFLCNTGHCENLTIVKTYFEHVYRDYELLPLFEKLWNIDKYVPTLDTDPLNQICLAVYALTNMMRIYNGKGIPRGVYKDCLDYIYELTEGRPELNDSVVMTGAFAGAYCSTR